MHKLTTPTARWLCALLLCATPWAHTQPNDAWRTVPLVDAHFHLMAFMTPADLLARMDRHHISHTVSAGAIGSPAIGHPNLRDSNAAAAIGPRFLPAVGNAELVNAERVEGLGRLLERWPSLTLVLSHCGKTTKAQDIRVFLEKHPKVVCDLGYRSLPQEANDHQRFPERTIFWAAAPGRPAHLNPDWKQLIEDHPDRFMVAVDDTHDWAQYDEVVRALREGLLAQLNPSVVERVAHGNARRVFKLAP